jgi:malate synthase
MEDAATAEIARVQLWQWVFHKARLDTGHPITASYVENVLRKAAGNVKSLVSGVSDKHIRIAAEYMVSQIKAERPSDFLTSDLMPYLEQLDGGKWVKSSL